MSKNLRNEIIEVIGISAASGTGRYLGSLPNHGKVKRDNFKCIQGKMQSKLSGWKGQCLSMAGRVM